MAREIYLEVSQWEKPSDESVMLGDYLWSCTLGVTGKPGRGLCFRYFSLALEALFL